jgi:hypothetical protein
MRGKDVSRGVRCGMCTAKQSWHNSRVCIQVSISRWQSWVFCSRDIIPSVVLSKAVALRSCGATKVQYALCALRLAPTGCSLVGLRFAILTYALQHAVSR